MKYISFIPVTTRCGVVVQLEVDGVGGRGGDAASCSMEKVQVDRSWTTSLKRKVCLISWECTNYCNTRRQQEQLLNNSTTANHC